MGRTTVRQYDGTAGEPEPVGIERFEDLISWQEARKLVKLVYALTDKPRFKKDYELQRQTRAAAVSGMGNVAEAHRRFTFEDKRHFYEIAHGSIEELQSHSTSPEIKNTYHRTSSKRRMSAPVLRVNSSTGRLVT